MVLLRVDHEVCHRVLRLDHLYEAGDSCQRSGSRGFHFRAKWYNRVSSPNRNLACSHSSAMQGRFLARVLNLQCLPRIGGGICLHRRVLFWQRLPLLSFPLLLPLFSLCFDFLPPTPEPKAMSQRDVSGIHSLLMGINNKKLKRPYKYNVPLDMKWKRLKFCLLFFRRGGGQRDSKISMG